VGRRGTIHVDEQCPWMNNATVHWMCCEGLRALARVRGAGEVDRMDFTTAKQEEGFSLLFSCLLYFSSIDYINRPAGRPYLARDPYLLKALNKLIIDNLST
jgi:hypothetical protein